MGRNGDLLLLYVVVSEKIFEGESITYSELRTIIEKFPKGFRSIDLLRANSMSGTEVQFEQIAKFLCDKLKYCRNESESYEETLYAICPDLGGIFFGMSMEKLFDLNANLYKE